MSVHRVFIGYDPRQPLAYNVAQFSILQRASEPVTISPLMIRQLPLTRTGLTAFTFSRFLVPWLCDYEGWALFMDCDVIVLGDIAELFGLADDRYDVMVVKNPRYFEWPSVTLFNCSRCRLLTPEFVENPSNNPLDLKTWVEENRIGDLPATWNHLVGYDPPQEGVKLAHFTQGAPFWPEVEGCEFELEWFRDHRRLNHVEPWASVMANSVHAANAGGKRVANLQLPDGGRAGEAHRQGVKAVPPIPTPVFDPALTRESPSPRYRELIDLYRQMHENGAPEQGIAAEQIFDGHSLKRHTVRIKELIDAHGARSLLDYGAGKGRLYDRIKISTSAGDTYENLAAFWGIEDVRLYDPAFVPHSMVPEGTFDGVICSDVLEHCPEQDIGWIVDELFRYANKFLFASVACLAAKKTLPTGENCHVTIKVPEWWTAVFRATAAKYDHVRWTLVLDIPVPRIDSGPKTHTIVVDG